MNNFKIKIGGSQVTAVFPLTYAELLDERLDEAQITFFSRTKFYKPTTLVEIEITTGGITEVERYVVANDYSVEYPVGSGKWKHTTYIIEETKLADGILCSSLTFTNANGNMYTDASSPVIAIDSLQANDLNIPYGFSISTIHSPVLVNETISIPSAASVGKELCLALLKLTYKNVPGYVFEESTSRNGWVAKLIEDGIVMRSKEYYTDTTSGLYEGDPQPSIANALFCKVDTTSLSKMYYDKEVPEFYTQPSNQAFYSIPIRSLTDGTLETLRDAFLGRSRFTFTFPGVTNKLPLKKWTIADVADRVLECAEPLFGSDENAVPRYKMSDAFREKYKNVLAPEFSMTQCTLREQLKVIGGFIHGEPYLEGGVWDFVPLGDNKEADVSGGKLVYRKYAYDINSYCTEVRSNAQNLVSSLSFAKGVIADPGRSLARSIRTDQVNARVTADNGYAASQHPIYSISRVLCGIRATDGTGWEFGKKLYDITPYVFERSEYDKLSSYDGTYPLAKAYAIYYTQGQKGLHGLFFRNPDSISTSMFNNYAIANIFAAASGYPLGDIKTYLEGKATVTQNYPGHPDLLCFRIEYRPIYSAFVSHGKGEYTEESQPYMMLYNQNENLTETSYFGENIKGVAARLGNVDQERTYIFSDRSKVPRCGTMLDGYCISAVSTQIMPSFVKCTLGLTKDFNRISEYVGISSVKRMYEVSERQTYQREIHIKETVIIGTETRESGKNLLSLNLSDSMRAFRNTASKDKLPVTSASVNTVYSNWETIDTAILPCAVTPLGNSLAFSFGFEDNYSAGQTTYYKDNEDGSNITGRFQFSHPYCDYYGRVYYLAAMLGSAKVDKPALATVLPDDQGSFYNNADNFDSSLFINHHRVRKDSREILSYTVEIEYKSANSDIYIGSELPKRTNYVADSGEERGLTCYLTNQDISNLDSVFRPTSEDVEIEPYISMPYSSQVNILMNNDAIESCKYFVLCNPIKATETVVSNEAGGEETVTEYSGGEIILSGKTSAVSKNLSATRTLTLYFSTK